MAKVELWAQAPVSNAERARDRAIEDHENCKKEEKERDPDMKNYMRNCLKVRIAERDAQWAYEKAVDD